MTTSYHTAAWLLWTLAAMLPALLTRNPLYLMIVLLLCTVARASSRVERPAMGLHLSARLGLAIVALSAVFNGLTLHYGDTRLVALPDWIPVFGGPVTLEALTFGAISGLAIVTLLAVFAVFNAAVDHAGLLKMTPAFLFQAGLAASIAITFVPQTMRSWREIREAQMIRGHRLRGLRDLLPLFLPLIATGLEKSIQLAEAMESRGFGRATPDDGGNPGRSLWLRVVMTTALLSLLTGLYARYFVPRLGAEGMVLIVVSMSAIGAALWWSSRQGRRSRYRRLRWQWHDLALALGSLAVVTLFLWLNFTHSDALFYHPYPRVKLPPFDPVIGLSLLLLGLPAVPVTGVTSHE